MGLSHTHTHARNFKAAFTRRLSDSTGVFKSLLI